MCDSVCVVLQVYEMDSKLLDARRPKVAKPTAEHREERLIPYAAQVCSFHVAYICSSCGAGPARLARPCAQFTPATRCLSGPLHELAPSEGLRSPPAAAFTCCQPADQIFHQHEVHFCGAP